MVRGPWENSGGFCWRLREASWTLRLARSADRAAHNVDTICFPLLRSDGLHRTAATRHLVIIIQGSPQRNSLYMAIFKRILPVFRCS